MRLGADLFGCTAQILRGATQLATSPLALLRASWRTLLSDDKEQTFQERKSVRTSVANIERILQEDSNLTNRWLINVKITSLVRKADSNRIKKQPVTHPVHDICDMPIDADARARKLPPEKKIVNLYSLIGTNYGLGPTASFSADEKQKIQAYVNSFKP